MTSENYRQILNHEFEAKEMTKEDFDNTLMHFAMLYHTEKLRLCGVMPSLPDGLDDDSNCDYNFKLGWIACWKALTGNEA